VCVAYVWLHVLYQVLASSSAALLNLDRTFKIELAWLAGDAYAALATRMEELTMLCFPTEKVATSLAQCEKRLKALKETTMFKCSSRPSQSACDALRGVVAKMVAGSPPADSMKTGGGIYTKAWDRFQYFVRQETSKGVMVFGEQALELRLADLQAKLKAEERPAKLHELDIFKAMLLSFLMSVSCSLVRCIRRNLHWHIVHCSKLAIHCTV
jgi:hypothetical protein